MGCGKTKVKGHKQYLSCHTCWSAGLDCMRVQLCAPHGRVLGVHVPNILCPGCPDSGAVGHVFLHTLDSSSAASTGCGLRPAQHSRSRVSFTQGNALPTGSGGDTLHSPFLSGDVKWESFLTCFCC